MRLSELHPKLTRDERISLAQQCGISTGYLWQLATRWKGKKPTVDLLAKMAEVEPRLHVHDLVQEFSEPDSKAPATETEPKAA